MAQQPDYSNVSVYIYSVDFFLSPPHGFFENNAYNV